MPRRAKGKALYERAKDWMLFLGLFVALLLAGVPIAASVGWGVSQDMAGPTLATSTIDLPGPGILKDSNYLLTSQMIAQKMGTGII